MKIIRHVSIGARYLTFSALVAVALASAVLRFWLMPKAVLYREQLQTLIGGMIGETVQIRALAGRMHGFTPQLVLEDFSITDAAGEHAPLSFRQVRVGIDPLRSLLKGSFVLDQISLVDATLTLQHKADGSLGVAGLQPCETFPFWILSTARVELRNISLNWQDLQRDAASLFLGRANLVLRNDADRHGLDLRLDLPANLGKSLRLGADINGDIRRWNGRVYVQARNLRESLLGDLQPFPLKMRTGAANFELWGDWRDGALQQVVSRFDLGKSLLAYRSESGTESQLALQLAKGWLRWRGDERGWRIDGSDFSLQLAKNPWPATRFAIAVQRDERNGLRDVNAAVSYLRFDDGLVLAEALPMLAESMRQNLRELSMRGEARDVRLAYRASQAASAHWGVCAQVVGLGFNAWRGHPGVKDLNGEGCGNDQKGALRLSMENAEFEAPRWFRRPLRINTAQAKIGWQRDEAGLSLAVKQLMLAAPGLEGTGRVRLHLPNAEAGSPFLDLGATLARVDLARLHDYLPLPAMGNDTAAWLDTAFRAGKMERAKVLFHGTLAEFPFAGGEGVFEAVANTENLELDFNPRWPHLYNVNANLLFYGAAVSVDAVSGRIGEVPINFVHAELPDLQKAARVTVTGEVRTHLPAVMKFLQQTPLRYIPERLLPVLEPQGDSEIALNLGIPLEDEAGDFEADGVARLKNVKLGLKGLDQEIQHVHGDLRFTQNGLEGKDIKGTGLGAPLSIDVDQQDGNILIGATGRVSVPVLAKTFPGMLWQHAHGAFGFRFNLQIPQSMDTSNAPLRIGLTSDLLGLGLDLPAPLGKLEKSKQTFKMDLALKTGARTDLDFRLGEEGRGQLVLADDRDGLHVEAGQLTFGRQPPEAAKEQAGGLAVRLDELDLSAWRSFLNGTAPQAIGSLDSLPRAFKVNVSRLVFNRQDWGDWSLTARREDSAWSGSFDGNIAKGEFKVQTPEFGPSHLKLDIAALNLSKLPDQMEPSAGTEPDPAALPSLEVHAKQLLWREVDLGDFALDTERWSQGMNIKKLELQTANHRLSLKGDWKRDPDGDETKLEGRVDVKDLGKSLTELGFAREIRNTPVATVFHLGWRGAPRQFSAARVDGEIRLKLGRGRILQLEPGLARALGMLNLGTLGRLLTLDFSDIFGKGLAYDGMEGRFRLANGQARTDAFLIDAVAANILISGRIGLIAHDFDQEIEVTPHALASVPLAGAIVGGAAVGAAIDMAQKMVGMESANIASSHYAVKGTWADPQVTRIEGNMPLDILDRAWTGLKNLSGFAIEGEQQ